MVSRLSLKTSSNPRLRHVGSIGMAVRDDSQNNGGLGVAGAGRHLTDNWLALTRIALTVFLDNSTAVALYQKFGFEIEGTHRHHAFRDGDYIDAYSMARPWG